MKIPKRAFFAAAFSLGLATIAASTLGPSANARATPAPSASSAASVSASASAAPPAPLAGAAIPTDASPPPSAGDWKDAVPVAVTRGKTECRLLRLREWLRIECPQFIGAGLVAGDPKEVRAWMSGNPMAWDATTNQRLPGLALVEIPLRRGQSFIATFLRPEFLYEGATFAEGDTFQIAWREGAADPVIVASQPARTTSSF
ncbi:MAG TPA: hypothetical protein VL400_09400 [Polyangiaceae bacterium]|nr:hypothetical protein [Polyangiaceae bacterium]